jgi:uncharacterized SAM-binding protein YcdF (DUF218 family)
MNQRHLSTQLFLCCALCFTYADTEAKTEKQLPDGQKALEHYDVIIVPGVPYKDPKLEIIFKARMLWANYLYQNGVADNIIFSGGAVYNSFVEGKIMKIYADSLHIPSAHTFAEIQAEHSTENVYYSLLLAKQLGFKKIAVATDQYQAIIIRNFMKKNCPDVDLVLIDYKKINLITAPWPEIEPSSACTDNFVSLVERENKVKRLKGTLGKNINYVSTDSTAGKEEQAIYPIAKLNALYNSSTESVSSLFSIFNKSVTDH